MKESQPNALTPQLTKSSAHYLPLCHNTALLLFIASSSRICKWGTRIAAIKNGTTNSVGIYSHYRTDLCCLPWSVVSPADHYVVFGFNDPFLFLNGPSHVPIIRLCEGQVRRFGRTLDTYPRFDLLNCCTIMPLQSWQFTERQGSTGSNRFIRLVEM